MTSPQRSNPVPPYCGCAAVIPTASWWPPASSRNPAGATCTFTAARPYPRNAPAERRSPCEGPRADERSGLLVLVIVPAVAVLVQLSPANLSTDLARRQRCRVNVGVGSIGLKSVYQRV